MKNISIGIQKGECFGLLGLNGAGKTSTFQILTGEETATSGHVFIDGFSVTDNIQKVRHYYCLRCEMHEIKQLTFVSLKSQSLAAHVT